MGEAEINLQSQLIIIRSHFIVYGDAASQTISTTIAKEIETMWNEPGGIARFKGNSFRIVFEITGTYEPSLDPAIVWYNDNPRNNYFRVEEFAYGNISFVDGIGSNTGYFKLDNLLNNSTTAAHEYGHTIGLVHPKMIDIRGAGIPGIMYPRGTICDPEFQYDPAAQPLAAGGTMNPRFRKVLPGDIEDLEIDALRFSSRGLARLGEFTSIYHEKELP